MSMVLGLLPIVGAPLPIMSYGGSSMLSIMIGLGIVMSCKIHQQGLEHCFKHKIKNKKEV